MRISEEHLARHPDDADALLVEGDALAALGRPREAEAVYRKVLTIKRSSAEARMGIGRLLLESNPAGAEALFLETLAQDPRNAKALNDLGVSRDLQGRHTDAQEAYRRALGVDPGSRAAGANLAISEAITRPAPPPHK